MQGRAGRRARRGLGPVRKSRAGLVTVRKRYLASRRIRTPATPQDKWRHLSCANRRRPSLRVGSSVLPSCPGGLRREPLVVRCRADCKARQDRAGSEAHPVETCGRGSLVQGYAGTAQSWDRKAAPGHPTPKIGVGAGAKRKGSGCHPLPHLRAGDQGEGGAR